MVHSIHFIGGVEAMGGTDSFDSNQFSFILFLEGGD